MSRPATKRQAIAAVLDIPPAKVKARLRKLHETSSLRTIATYLTERGVPVSKDWVHKELGKPEKGTP
jgi:DNA-binding Lrp family transcriptional regulator